MGTVMATTDPIVAYQQGFLAEWNLRDDEVAFAQEYVANGLDGKAAYLAVKPGVTPGTAAKQACVWLKKNNELRRYIEFLKGKAAMRAEVTAAEFLEKTRRLYHQCSGDIPVTETVNDEEGMPVDVKRKVFHPGGAGKAVEMLGRYAGVFVDKSEVAVESKEPVAYVIQPVAPAPKKPSSGE